MEISVYKINKGINKPIEFKGLKAQYIWYLGGGLIGLLIVFAIMYIIGINAFICLGLILGGGALFFMYIYRLSNTHGEFGMMKKIAKRKVPGLLTINSRTVFTCLKEN